MRAAQGYLSDGAQGWFRTPPGHPEDYIEAFANIYRNFSKVLQAKLENSKADPAYYDFPTVEEGVRGMKFIDAVISSGNNNAAWTKIED